MDDATDDLAARYWAEAAERAALKSGTTEQRREYLSKSFPIEEELSTRVDDHDRTLIADLVAIAESAPDPESLELFGAGAVWEALYNADAPMLSQVESSATSSVAFREALVAAFAGWDDLPKDARKRLGPLIEGSGASE